MAGYKRLFIYHIIQCVPWIAQYSLIQPQPFDDQLDRQIHLHGIGEAVIRVLDGVEGDPVLFGEEPVGIVVDDLILVAVDDRDISGIGGEIPCRDVRLLQIGQEVARQPYLAVEADLSGSAFLDRFDLVGRDDA